MNQEATQPGRTEPNVVFARAMYAVETRRHHLAVAIDMRDSEAIAHTARSAADIWLAGRSACRRLIARSNSPSPYADAARRLLDENYMTLMELFARATRVIAIPRTQKVMQEVRAMLMTAMASPIDASPFAMKQDTLKCP